MKCIRDDINAYDASNKAIRIEAEIEVNIVGCKSRSTSQLLVAYLGVGCSA